MRVGLYRWRSGVLVCRSACGCLQNGEADVGSHTQCTASSRSVDAALDNQDGAADSGPERSIASTELDSDSSAHAPGDCVMSIHDSDSDVDSATASGGCLPTQKELTTPASCLSEPCAQFYEKAGLKVDDSLGSEETCAPDSIAEGFALTDSDSFGPDSNASSLVGAESSTVAVCDVEKPAFTLDEICRTAASLARKAAFPGVANGTSQKLPASRRAKRRLRSPGVSASVPEPGDGQPSHRQARMGGVVELRQDRRRRDAEFRLGELKAKPPVVHIDPSARGASVESTWWVLEILRAANMEIPHTPMRVLLPVPPNPAQRIIAQAACEAIDVGGYALLEAPTGTGKTLAILGAALSWQWAEVEAMASHEGVQAGAAQKLDPAAQAAAPPQVHPPRVVWVARTHEQLLHAVNEFRRLPYRPIMSLRLSRERFCLHPNVRTARNKAEACELATTILPRKPGPGARRGQAPQPSGCSYLEHAEAIRYPQSLEHRRRYELGGPLATYDIEDLVREAEALHICPFHTVGDLSMEGAGLIFITYNQLLDPLVRFAGGYEPLFQDAIIAVDEAHNLSDEAREVASFSATADQLQEMRSHFEDVGEKLPDATGQKIAKRLVAAVAKMRTWLLQARSCPAGAESVPGGMPFQQLGPSSPDVRIAGGTECLALVRHCGLESVKLVDRDIRDLKKLRKDLMWLGLESTAVRSAAVNELESFLWKMRFVLDGGSSDYRLAVHPDPKVQFICLRGAVALEPAVRPARSVVLLSGTLSPFDVLVQELGLDKGKRSESGTSDTLASTDSLAQCPAGNIPRALRTCQAPHHEGLEKMCVACAVGAVGQVRLDSRFRCRSDAYLDAVGEALHAASTVIPNGVVVFLPSYALLDALIRRLRSTGRYEVLAAGRSMFVEQRGELGVGVLSSYRAAAARGPAMLLAVMRGKAAEGVDLRDAEARGCLVVGVPFPQLAVEVELRRRAPGGAKWYEAEAMRQVSQAAGRLLRHQADFGALVLLDGRFAGRTPPELLAPWLRSLLRPTSIEGMRDDLTKFFTGKGVAVSKRHDSWA